MGDLHLLRDLRQRQLPLPRRERRGASDDAQPGNRRKRAQNLLRETVGEVIVVLIRAQVCKRQDDQGDRRLRVR